MPPASRPITQSTECGKFLHCRSEVFCLRAGRPHYRLMRAVDRRHEGREHSQFGTSTVIRIDGWRCQRGVAQSGSAPALGAGGRWFESSRPEFKSFRFNCLHSLRLCCDRGISGATWRVWPLGDPPSGGIGHTLRDDNSEVSNKRFQDATR